MVTGVEEYFKILEELQKNNTTLPINIQSGEPFFDVDLNNRLIIVPPEFKKYIAVQRDHNIETIYFRVDRYFDTTDLSELTCVVQFTNARKESGIHLVSEKDITTYSSDGKMILGWKLNRDFTQYPGTVTYSIRFYRLDENKKFIYDLHTIPAIGIIAPGLDTLADTNAEEDTRPVANLITDLIDRVDYACGPEMNGMMKNNINAYFAENPVKEDIKDYLSNHQVVSDDQVDNAVHEYLTENPPTGGATNVQVDNAVNGYFERNDISEKINDCMTDYSTSVSGLENAIGYDINLKEVPLDILDGVYNFVNGNINKTLEKYKHTKLDVSKYKSLIISGTSGSTADTYSYKLYAFYDKDMQLIGEPFGEDDTVYQNIKIDVPQSAKTIIINSTKGADLAAFYEEKVFNDIVPTKDFEKKTTELSTNVSNIFKSLGTEKWVEQNVEKKSGCYKLDNGYIHANESWEHAIFVLDGTEKELKISGYSGGMEVYGLYGLYDENNNLIGQMPYDGQKKYTDVIVTIPENARKIIVNSVSKVSSPVIISKKETVIDKVLPAYKNKKILFMGDSITALNLGERGWCRYFNEIIEPSLSVNIAVASSRWCSFPDTVYDGNPVFNGADANHNNVMGNQIEKLLRGKDSNHEEYSKVDEYDDFDIIMIAEGTNDGDSYLEENYEQYFTNDNEIVDLETLSHEKYAAIFRYTIETLRRLYPNAQIYICTPIQRAAGGYTWGYNHAKMQGDYLKLLAKRMSVEVIDTFECGIYGHYEISGANGQNLIDGLHPNDNGAKKMGLYNAKKLIAKYI